MLNIKDKVFSSIVDLAENIGDTYPEDFGNLPAIQYAEEENKVHTWADGKEYESYVRYRFDIWAEGSTSQLACELDTRVSKLGLKRIQCTDVEDQSPEKHKMMRYEGIINPDDERVTHR